MTRTRMLVVRSLTWRRRTAYVAVAGLVLWMLALVPTGLHPEELLVFTAPAAALGVFMSWLSYALVPARWQWRSALGAACASAALLPPLLAALITVAGLSRPPQLITLFVLGAWCALGAGLIAAAARRRSSTRPGDARSSRRQSRNAPIAAPPSVRDHRLGRTFSDAAPGIVRLPRRGPRITFHHDPRDRRDDRPGRTT